MAKKLNIRPLRDRIIVRRLEEIEKTKGGIIIPDSAKEKPQEAEVVAVGSGRVDESGKTIPVEVKVGDKVLFSKYSGTEIKIDNEDYLILQESDVQAVVLS
ncbi:MAG: co-chaperone GroES [Deltaproteobacteria bacterium]|nr:co-chaperone GroES [Deltaproteobacteria bacterium]